MWGWGVYMCVYVKKLVLSLVERSFSFLRLWESDRLSFSQRVLTTVYSVIPPESLSVLYITHYGTAEIVSGESFQVVVEQDTSIPTFLCFTRATIPPTLTWQKLNTSGTLPSEVTQRVPIDMRGGVGLVWGRGLVYTDSGLYSCNSSTNAIILDLLVTCESH